MTKIIKILAEEQPEKIINVVFLSIVISKRVYLFAQLYVIHNKLNSESSNWIVYREKF